MKLHQLKYIHEVARQGFSVSAAAEALHTSQPGVSKQIQLLEEELKLQIFQRNGKRLTGITEPGKKILKLAASVIFELDNIKRVGDEFSKDASGMLTIATTHTQARYKLPGAIQQFMQTYPQVKLNIHQGNPTQVTDWVATGEADVGIATESIGQEERLICLPCYEWNRSVVVPKGHDLEKQPLLTLQDIADHPLITYDFAFTGSTTVSKVFHDAGVTPNVVLTAIDADVIKTYVNLGLGIGLIANMAFDEKRDEGLVCLDCSHLFPQSTTHLGIRKDTFMRGYLYDFIGMLSPKFDRAAIDEVFKITR
ncbi:MAG: LysR family cys regulon transcriptional activator [Methylophilaceae bacterium]|jgi:LysR family cys regulon transcriptional activator|tara:strand:- start:6467 stop:7393 length:927 start_codon:yes stop_codon:yes gene_type:complete